jgi:hypothetical protein
VDGPNGDRVVAYREQTVEIALGPKGAFENGNIGVDGGLKEQQIRRF